MKHWMCLLIRHILGRQSTSMVLLLMIPLLLALIQPIASQVYVNSSSYDGNIRTPGPEQASQTQESLRLSRPIGWTEVPDQIMVSRAKTTRITDRDASIGVYEKGDTISNVQPESINNTVEETSTEPSKMQVKVDLTAHSVSPNNRSNGGPSRTQDSTDRHVTTVLAQKIGGYPEKEATTFIPMKQDSGGTTVATVEKMPQKSITNPSKEDWSMSAVLPPTVISLVKSSTVSDDADRAQTSHTFLTTVSTTHIKPTAGLVFQTKASAATLTNNKSSTSVHSPVVADRTNTSGADLGGA